MIAALLACLLCCQDGGAPPDAAATLRHWEGMVQRAPADARARFELGKVLAINYIARDAIDHFGRAIELGLPAPLADEARWWRVLLLEEHGRAREALAEANAVLKTWPPDHPMRGGLQDVQRRITERHAALAGVAASETRATVVIVLIPLLLLAGWAAGRKIAARAAARTAAG